MTGLHPHLPVFDAEFARKHATSVAGVQTAPAQPPQAHSNGTTQSTERSNDTVYAVHDDDDEDEDDGYGPDEHPAHYVRPGKGLMSTLPPDAADEHILVDDDSSKTVFHHIYMIDEKAANDGVNSKK